MVLSRLATPHAEKAQGSIFRFTTRERGLTIVNGQLNQYRAIHEYNPDEYYEPFGIDAAAEALAVVKGLFGTRPSNY